MAPTQESASSDATVVAGSSAERSFASGRYVVRRVLPGGAQKTVYLVHDTALDRECALALIKTDALEPLDQERLRREARALARLDHPNIVAVYDISEANGRPFFVSEYITGGDLRAALREAGGPLPMERALSIAADLARALARAHEHGIVHRDVKPANVWLTDEGVAKLGDFGLAFSIDRTRLTLSGAVVGTAAYMPPEQALGQTAGARSDLYALGCVLYELLTGRPPFLGDHALAVISQHVSTPPVALSWSRADVPPRLEGLVLRLLAKLPEDRPESAAAVIAELHAISRQFAEPDSRVEPLGRVEQLHAVAWGRFIGRPAELEQLQAAFGSVASGQGAVIMLSGEAGIGKTRLAEEFCIYARLRGAQVLHGRCYEGESSLSFHPLAEALRRYVRSRPDGVLREELGTAAREIATLVPDVQRRFQEIGTAPALDGESERQRLFQSVSEFLRRAAVSAPLVLFLDDLQWADSSSLSLVRHLAGELARERVLILGAYRDSELDRSHPLAGVLANLRRECSYRRVLVRGLPEADVVELLDAIESSEETSPGRQALAQALHRETEGNPFFIREVLSHLIEEGHLYRAEGHWTTDVSSITNLGIPEGVREVVGRRLSRLSRSCNQMLTLSSTMPDGFTWDALVAVTGETEESLLDALDEALAAQVIHEGMGERQATFEFTHGLIRQTLYEELSGPRRAALHRRVGEALERLYAANLDPHFAELAFHFYQAAPNGDASKAILYARRAGDRAMAMTAYEQAAAHYEKALASLVFTGEQGEFEACEIMLQLGEAYDVSGDYRKAEDTFAQAVTAAQRLRLSKHLAQAALGLTASSSRIALSFPGVPGRIELFEEGQQSLVAVEGASTPRPAVDALEETLKMLPAGDSALRAHVMARLAPASDTRERAISLSQAAVAMARRVDDPAALFDALETRHFYSRSPDDVSERLNVTKELARTARERGDKATAMSAEYVRSVLLLQLGQRDLADEARTRFADISAELQQPEALSMAASAQAAIALLDGRFAEAEALIQRAFSMGTQRLQGYMPFVRFGMQMIGLRREQGRLSEMEQPVKAIVAGAPQFPSWRATLSLLYTDLARDDEARAEYEPLAADDFAEVLRQPALWFEGIVILGEVCARLGDRSRAAVLYDRLLPYAHLNVILMEDVYCAGSASRTLGLLASTMERWLDAERHFEEALAMNARLRAWPWLAHTQYDLARTLLSRDGPAHRDAARQLLLKASQTARDLGMTALIGRIAATGVLSTGA